MLYSEILLNGTERATTVPNGKHQQTPQDANDMLLFLHHKGINGKGYI